MHITELPIRPEEYIKEEMDSLVCSRSDHPMMEDYERYFLNGL